MMGLRETALGRFLRLTFATVVAAAFFAPFVMIVAESFGGEGAVVNYGTVIQRTPFLRYAFNSLVIAVGTVSVVYSCTLLAGYGFAKLQMRGKNLLYNAILVGLVLPVLTIIVPVFIGIQRLGLFSNPLAVIVPLSAVVVPLTVMLTRNYIAELPDEMFEAARVDGATSFQALVRLVFPLSTPITAVVIVWTFLQAWNEFFLPLLVLQHDGAKAITQVPALFTSQYGSDVPKIFASLVLMCIPVTVAYLSAQSLFQRGLTAGSVK